MRVWDLATGRCQRTMDGHEQRLTAVAVVEDGRLASGGMDGQLRVWHSVSGAPLQTLPPPPYI